MTFRLPLQISSKFIFQKSISPDRLPISQILTRNVQTLLSTQNDYPKHNSTERAARKLDSLLKTSRPNTRQMTHNSQSKRANTKLLLPQIVSRNVRTLLSIQNDYLKHNPTGKAARKLKTVRFLKTSRPNTRQMTHNSQSKRANTKLKGTFPTNPRINYTNLLHARAQFVNRRFYCEKKNPCIKDKSKPTCSSGKSKEKDEKIVCDSKPKKICQEMKVAPCKPRFRPDCADRTIRPKCVKKEAPYESYGDCCEDGYIGEYTECSCADPEERLVQPKFLKAIPIVLMKIDPKLAKQVDPDLERQCLKEKGEPKEILQPAKLKPFINPCKQLKMKGCQPRGRPSCDRDYTTPPCKKIEAPYESFSDCCPQFPDIELTECDQQEKNVEKEKGMAFLGLKKLKANDPCAKPKNKNQYVKPKKSGSGNGGKSGGGGAACAMPSKVPVKISTPCDCTKKQDKPNPCTKKADASTPEDESSPSIVSTATPWSKAKSPNLVSKEKKTVSRVKVKLTPPKVKANKSNVSVKAKKSDPSVKAEPEVCPEPEAKEELKKDPFKPKKSKCTCKPEKCLDKKDCKTNQLKKIESGGKVHCVCKPPTPPPQAANPRKAAACPMKKKEEAPSKKDTSCRQSETPPKKSACSKASCKILPSQNIKTTTSCNSVRNLSLWDRIVNYFKARPGCPAPDDYKKKDLIEQASKLGLKVCPEPKPKPKCPPISPKPTCCIEKPIAKDGCKQPPKDCGVRKFATYSNNDVSSTSLNTKSEAIEQAFDNYSTQTRHNYYSRTLSEKYFGKIYQLRLGKIGIRNALVNDSTEVPPHTVCYTCKFIPKKYLTRNHDSNLSLELKQSKESNKPSR